MEKQYNKFVAFNRNTSQMTEAIDKLEIPALNKGRVPQYLKANIVNDFIQL